MSMTADLPDGRAVIVHGLDDALTVLAVARDLGVRVTLVSAPGAAAYVGAGWFKALTDRARAAIPDHGFVALLDCGDRAGDAQAAIRAGVDAICFTGRAEVAGRLAAIATAAGVGFCRHYPQALELRGERDRAAACRAWLQSSPA